MGIGCALTTNIGNRRLLLRGTELQSFASGLWVCRVLKCNLCPCGHGRLPWIPAPGSEALFSSWADWIIVSHSAPVMDIAAFPCCFWESRSGRTKSITQGTCSSCTPGPFKVAWYCIQTPSGCDSCNARCNFVGVFFWVVYLMLFGVLPSLQLIFSRCWLYFSM